MTKELITSKGFLVPCFTLKHLESLTKSPLKSKLWKHVRLICIKSKRSLVQGIKFQSCLYMVKTSANYIPLIIRNKKKYSLTYVYLQFLIYRQKCQMSNPKSIFSYTGVKNLNWFDFLQNGHKILLL